MTIDLQSLALGIALSGVVVFAVWFLWFQFRAWLHCAMFGHEADRHALPVESDSFIPMVFSHETTRMMWFPCKRCGVVVSETTTDYGDEATEKLQALVDHAHGISRPSWPEPDFDAKRKGQEPL